METLQQHIHTVVGVKKSADKYMSDNSTGILHKYRFDKEHTPNKTRFLITGAFSFLLCADMDCEFLLSEEVLEKMKFYIEKRN